MSFSNLNLIEPLLKALREEEYVTPTPIQQQSIPIILNRKDLLGCAQTGTGKTAAFALPLLQLMDAESADRNTHSHNAHTGGPADHSKPGHPKATGPIRALILTPTRELAIQIEESFRTYGKYIRLRHLVIFGGVPQHAQVQALQKGIDILVATPGRLLDLMDQGYVQLRDIRYFVLDEADRMLDMGFIHDVKKIIAKLPQKRQSLFFSATMPPEIQRLAASILVNPEKVEVTPASTTAETVSQSVYFVEKKDKRDLLLHLLKSPAIPTVLVFTRTKHGADKVAQSLSRAGVRAEAIHGNKSQNARQSALLNFKSRRTRVLVATDIAARGIDIDELTHVINFELPNIPETYIHRIGRTGRAGASGIALSFCDAEEKEYLRDIQKLISFQIPVAQDNPFAMSASFVPTDRQNRQAIHAAAAAKPSLQRPPVQRAPAQRPPLRKAPVQKAPIQKAPGQKAPVQKAPDQKPPAQKPPNQKKGPSGHQQPPVQKMPVRKPPQHAEDREAKRPPSGHRRPANDPSDDQIAMLGYVLRQDSGDEKW